MAQFPTCSLSRPSRNGAPLKATLSNLDKMAGFP